MTSRTPSHEDLEDLLEELDEELVDQLEADLAGVSEEDPEPGFIVACRGEPQCDMGECINDADEPVSCEWCVRVTRRDPMAAYRVVQELEKDDH